MLIPSFSVERAQEPLYFLASLRAKDALPQRCFVTHGDPPAATAMAEKLRESHGWKTETPSLFQKTVLGFD